jgi:hypothetical protein
MEAVMLAIQTDGLNFFAVYKTAGYARLEGDVHATLLEAIAEHPNVPLGRSLIDVLSYRPALAEAVARLAS